MIETLRTLQGLDPDRLEHLGLRDAVFCSAEQLKAVLGPCLERWALIWYI